MINSGSTMTASRLRLVLAIIILVALHLWALFLMSTVTFTDVLIVDTDTISFLLGTFTDLGWYATVVALIAVPLLAAIFWLDPLRVRVLSALVGLIVCFALLAGLSFAVPLDRGEEFDSDRFLSKFARSGAVVVALRVQGRGRGKTLQPAPD
jgi:hypothetical protein